VLRHRLAIAAASILVGWAALWALTYLIERPLLIWTAPVVGSHWIATVKLALDCLILAAVGWATGRLDRASPLPGVLLFAATLAFWPFSQLSPPIDLSVTPLIQLAAAGVHDARHLSLLATATVPYFFQFGSLIAGALLSRPAPVPFSLFGRNAR